MQVKEYIEHIIIWPDSSIVTVRKRKDVIDSDGQVIASVPWQGSYAENDSELESVLQDTTVITKVRALATDAKLKEKKTK